MLVVGFSNLLELQARLYSLNRRNGELFCDCEHIIILSRVLTSITNTTEKLCVVNQRVMTRIFEFLERFVSCLLASFSSLLLQVYTYLARKTEKKFNKIVLKRLFMARRFR